MAAKKTSATPTRIYVYGAFAPPDPAEHKLVREEIFRANQLRNKLVELERVRRDEYRRIRSSLSPLLADQELQHDVLGRQIIEARKALSNVPKKDRATSPICEAIRALRKQQADLWKFISVERKHVEEIHFRPYDQQAKDRKRALVEIELAKRVAAGQSPVVGPYVLARINAQITQEMASDAYPEAWRKVRAAEAAALVAVHKAKAESGCFPGTKAVVHDAALVSFKTSVFQPAFRKFDGNQRIGSQMLPPLRVDEAWGGARDVLQISARPARLGGKNIEQKRAAAARNGHGFCTAEPQPLAQARLRLQKGVYITIPFVLHRPIPQGTIQFAHLACNRVGTVDRYELHLTVESEDFVRKPTNATGKLAVNFGWRRLDNGDIRVATTWAGDASPKTQYVLPAKMWEQQAFANRCLGFADDHFLVARRWLAYWVTRISSRTIGIDLANVAQWRSHGKLAGVVPKMLEAYAETVDMKQVWREWRVARLNQHADLFDQFEVIDQWLRDQGITSKEQVLAIYLELWRRKDKHLIDMAREIQLRLQRARLDLYRKWAAQWARQYRDVVVELWDKRETAEGPEPEDDTRGPQEDAACKFRQFVGTGKLVECVKAAFGAERYTEEDARKISALHLGCGGEVLRPELTQSWMVTCPECGQRYDQDLNAARSLMMRSEQSRGALTTVGARKTKNEGNL